MRLGRLSTAPIKNRHHSNKSTPLTYQEIAPCLHIHTPTLSKTITLFTYPHPLFLWRADVYRVSRKQRFVNCLKVFELCKLHGGFLCQISKEKAKNKRPKTKNQKQKTLTSALRTGQGPYFDFFPAIEMIGAYSKLAPFTLLRGFLQN
jgi:hypothetical protein